LPIVFLGRLDVRAAWKCQQQPESKHPQSARSITWVQLPVALARRVDSLHDQAAFLVAEGPALEEDMS
jgi:hypothetical protein